MGIAGWLGGAILSYPVSVWVGDYFGQIFLHSNLQNTLSISGCIHWLVISVVLALGCGIIPAWKVATASLREMLAYE